MSQFFRRAHSRVVAVAIAATLLGPWSAPRPSEAALLAMRPGPIDRPLAIAAADFDRDGRDDLVVALYQAGVLQILLAQPDGTFAPVGIGPFGVGSATIGAATSGPFQMVVAELNADDVDSDAVPNRSDNCPNLYNPKDSFTGRQLDIETAPGPDLACGTADDGPPALNGPDGVCGTADDIVGDGVGEACEAGEDTNGDGVVDIPVDTDGDGVPDFDPATLILDNCPRMPNPGQEDAETARGPDTQCGTLDDDPSLYGPDNLCGTLDDLTGNRVGDACPLSPDLLVLTASQTTGSSLGALRIRMNDGEGGLVGRPSYLTGVGPGSITVGDFSGDPRPDVVITNTNIELVQVLNGEGDGIFGVQTFLTAGEGVQGSVAADLDGDGDSDLVVANRGADTLSVYLRNAGALPTTANSTPPTLDAPTVLLAGRLNADAFDDLVVLDQGATSIDGRIEVFLGAADGVPVAAQVIPLPAGQVPRDGLLLDLDGGGTLDLAVADFTGRQVLLFSGAGDGTFTAAGALPTAGEPTSLAPIELPAGAPGLPDLAVLQFSNRVDLFVNGGGLTFAAAPLNPASPWRDTSAMALFGADTLSGADLVLLQRSLARIDLLSGVGDSTFRPVPVQTIAGLADPAPANAAFMQVADLRLDNRPDLAVLDPTAGRLTVLSNELTGLIVERATTTVATGAAGLSAGSLLSTVTDVDRDGVLNDIDNCPAVYNPPGCRVTDPACPMEVPCAGPAPAPPACDPGNPATLDPVTGQCDGDRNGIGDHCQILSETCAARDSDFDLVPDYDPNALFRTNGLLDFDRDGFANVDDNCPTAANADQADANQNGVGEACEVLAGGQPVDPDFDGVPTFDPGTLALDNCPALSNAAQQDNDGDGVGNTCIIDAAIDNCPVTLNLTQTDSNGDGVGDLCAVPPVDLLLPNPVTGEVLLLGGDGTGALHPAAASPLSGLSGPVGAATGHFLLDCVLVSLCIGRADNDIAVAERGLEGNPSDDGVRVFAGDGAGGFSAQPARPVSGDPTGLIVAPDQPVCPVPGDPAQPTLRFDSDGRSDILVVPQAGSSDIRVLMVSNRNVIDPAQSSLIPPIPQPVPLPVPPPLKAVVTLDANRDGTTDLVALSAAAGGPSNLTLFMGIGSGLFFTDPTLNPAPVPAELALPVTGFINIKTDSVYPDVALFNVTDQAPITFFNILRERADIDGSGRVDGYDLALLAAAFGAERGEGFILQPDATLLQTGTGGTRRLVTSATPTPGQNVPDPIGACSTGFEPTRGLYGIPVDVNLDGIVDGEDLAFVASLFGTILTQ